MKIIVVGDGKVGYELAMQLSRENHDVVIIDRNEDILRRTGEVLDVICVKGNGASGAVLMEAGVDKCDVLIAATGSDELNMVCCLTGKKLGADNTIARIRDPEYASDINLLKRELGINLIINPEQATASEISRLLRFTGASNVEHFCGGRIELISVSLAEEHELSGVKLSKLRKRLSANILFCAVERKDEVFIPYGETEFEPGDKVYVMGEPSGLHAFCRQHGIQTARVRDLMIVGGGRVGLYLAAYMIKMGLSVKIIEKDAEICTQLTEDMPEALVVLGDGTDQELLEAEDIAEMDAFVSLTGRDEDNLIMSLYAQQQGVSKVVAKATRQNYAALVRGMGLSSVVSPKTITAAQIVRFVRGLQNRGDSHLDALYRIVNGLVDVLEFTVGKSFPLLGVPLKSMPRNPNLLVAALIRNHRAIIPDGNTHIEEGDKVILVAHDTVITALENAWNHIPLV